MNYKNVKHGCSRATGPSAEYRSWEGMRQRCNNPKNDSFEDYGGRGIAVCERWEAFENFLADMGLKPSPTHSIDRIDNDGNYEPGNCRWATPKEQRNNQRTSRRSRVMVTIGEVTKTISEWCSFANLPEGTISNRMRLGWTGERLLAPLEFTGSRLPRFITINGETKIASDWEKAVNLPHGVVRLRYARGWAENLLLAPLGYKRQTLPAVLAPGWDKEGA